MQIFRNLDAGARRARRRPNAPRPPSQAFWDGFSDGFWLTITPFAWREFERRAKALAAEGETGASVRDSWRAVGDYLRAAMTRHERGGR